MKRPVIRKANLSDLDALVQFNQAMAHETEQKELDTNTLTRGVSRVLEQPAHGFYLLAEINHTTAGSLLITEEWSDWRAARFWWIQSVYVKPEYRRQGIYRTLYQEVQNLAQAAGDICGLRLYVERENVNAQKTYQNLGMHESHYLMYETY